MLEGEHGTQWIIDGQSGVGKTTFVEQLLLLFREQGFGIVVVGTREDQLTQFGEASIIDTAMSGESVDWPEYFNMHKESRLVMAADDAEPFLDRMAQAILDREGMVVVFDDQHMYLSPNPPVNIRRLWAEGRSRNVHVITSTQSVGITGTFGTNLTARRNCAAIVAFQTVEGNELKRLQDYLGPHVREVPSLAVPGGYVFRDIGTGRAAVYHPDKGMLDLQLEPNARPSA